jgi:hypothetical protein
MSVDAPDIVQEFLTRMTTREGTFTTTALLRNALENGKLKVALHFLTSPWSPPWARRHTDVPHLPGALNCALFCDAAHYTRLGSDGSLLVELSQLGLPVDDVLECVASENLHLPEEFLEWARWRGIRSAFVSAVMRALPVFPRVIT